MNTLSPISWPPLYLIKKHRRAKSVKLRTRKPHGLIITVPYRFNLKAIPGILEENKVWITEQLSALQAGMNEQLPDKMILAALNETWTILYIKSNAKLELFQRPQHELVLVGPVDDMTQCKKKLIKWLKEKAAHYLLQHLQQVSTELQLTFHSLSVRDQDTLWGSCSVEKAINLNYKLIFLPPSLVRHVLIHELCHTRYLNHSDQFWHLVSCHDPAWQQNKRLLRQVNHLVPSWL